MNTNGHQNGHARNNGQLPSLPERLEQPWARIPGESDKAYTAFLRYRDMPAKHPDLHEQRSLANVTRLMGREGSIGRNTAWCSAFHWVQRALAWDVAVAQERDRAHFAAVADMSRRQALQAERTQHALSAATEALVRKINRDPEAAFAELGKLPTAKLMELVADLQHAFVKVASLERLARGADTARIDVHDSDALGLYDAILSNPTIAAHATALVRGLTEPPQEP